MPRHKAQPKPEPIAAVAASTPPCVVCGKPIELNSPERWVNETSNMPNAWWNTQDYYCPDCNVFMNANRPDQYVQPSGKSMETGRRIITLLNMRSGVLPDEPDVTFVNNSPTESANEPTHE